MHLLEEETSLSKKFYRTQPGVHQFQGFSPDPCFLELLGTLAYGLETREAL